MPLPECIRIAFSDEDTRCRLLTERWREVEVLETWQGPAPTAESETPKLLSVFNARKHNGDKNACEMADLAVASFKCDRLHADPLVDRRDADDAKRLWVLHAFEDRDKHMLAARLAGKMAGFLIWKRVKVCGKLMLLVDLLAVAETARRLKIARTLIAYAAAGAGLRLIRAGTQSTNEPARAFYASLGMKVVKRQRTFHR